MDFIGIDTPFAHVLNTNYAPSVVEQSMLRHLVQSPEGELCKIDEEISRLQARRHALEHFVDLHSALLSPCRRIPADVWRLIFIECLPQSPLGLCFRATRIAPLLLTTVCCSWREIALSTPKLWNSLHIFVPAPPPTFPDEHHLSMSRERIEGIKRWLDRSGSLPLTISLAAGLHDPVCSRARFGLFNVSISPAIRSLQTELMRLIARYSRRWKIIAFGANVRLTLDMHPFGMVTDDLPCLESFYSCGNLFWEMQEPANGGSETGPSTEQETLVDLLMRAPALRRLQLSHETISEAALSLPVAWHNLIELCLLYPSSHSLEPGRIMQLLSTKCHLLRTLSIELDSIQHTAITGRVPSISSPPPIWSSVQNLRVAFCCPCFVFISRREVAFLPSVIEVFEAVTLPSLTSLSVSFDGTIPPLADISEDNDYDDGDDSYTDHDIRGSDCGHPVFFGIRKLAFEDLLHRSQCAGGITHFELSAPHLFAVETVLRVLRLMGKLESLDFGLMNMARGGRGSQVGLPQPFRATRWQRGWSGQLFRELSSRKYVPILNISAQLGVPSTTPSRYWILRGRKGV
ncbi:hypothetical protein PM082_023285 [Marasmius tenuissimus]|nr:hypothetical protein PM082_023285 [Marasmius tenuissimus]